ncbi:MAG: 4Fe-4S binding protein [Synergistaceae bacterium]|nr:EFR1 family ferrodoxin [Synergistota bacterium]NLM71062.1 4Fe-4S binding protein [Synergistaceae bacterium]
MKESSVDLLFFTGTGNTLVAARSVANALREGGKTVRLMRLENGIHALSDDAALGIAVTTACFSTYPFAWEVLERLPEGRGRNAFAISTMAGYSGGLRGPLRSLVVKKGYRPLGYAEFLMPSNYANKSIPEGLNRERIVKCEEKAAKFATRLLEERTSWRRGGPLSPFFNLLARKTGKPWSFMKKLLPLSVDERKCIQCGKCVRLCPVKNIVMEEYPKFMDRCVACQRCFAFCPPAAIFVPGKDFKQYRAVDYDTLTSSDL